MLNIILNCEGMRNSYRQTYDLQIIFNSLQILLLSVNVKKTKQKTINKEKEHHFEQKTNVGHNQLILSKLFKHLWTHHTIKRASDGMVKKKCKSSFQLPTNSH